MHSGVNQLFGANMASGHMPNIIRIVKARATDLKPRAAQRVQDMLEGIPRVVQ